MGNQAKARLGAEKARAWSQPPKAAKTCRPRLSWCERLAGILTVYLSGCMVGPNYQRPETEMPANWAEKPSSATATQPSDADLAVWWKTLDDPMLDSLIERAVESNLNLQIAAERIREARAQRGVVAADLWPQVNVGTGYSYKGNSQNASPKLESSAGGTSPGPISIKPGEGGGPPTITIQPGSSGGAATPTIQRFSQDQNLFQAGFDASWELDLFGGTRRAVEAADAEIQAAEEDWRDVLVVLASEVARNYVEARGSQRRILVAQANIKAQAETVTLIESLFAAGVVNELDLAQARAQLAATRSQIPLLETAWRQSTHRLGVLLGQEPGALLAELAESRPVPAVPPEVPTGLPSDLLRRRPDIRRSERQLAAATARIGVATADLFPRFSLNGSFGSQTRDIQHFLDGRSLFWSVGPNMSWPIFDGGRIRSNIEIQNARQQQLFSSYRLVILTALQEVEDSLVAYEQEQIRHEHLAESLKASRRALDLANELYSRGVADFLSVLVSQRATYEAEDQLVQSETAAASRLIALYKALGGGWDAGAEAEAELAQAGG